VTIIRELDLKTLPRESSGKPFAAPGVAMQLRLWALALAAPLIYSPAVACSHSNFDVWFNGETTNIRASVGVGTECSFPFRMYGPVAHTTGATVISRSKRGRVSASGSGISYAPSTRGNDEFSVKVCGVSSRGPGCTTVVVAAEVN
jgi:hypothetical protein